MKLTCVIINRNNFRARIFNQIQIPARETSRSLGSRLRRSPLAIRDRLVGKSTYIAAVGDNLTETGLIYTYISKKVKLHGLSVLQLKNPKTIRKLKL